MGCGNDKPPSLTFVADENATAQQTAKYEQARDFKSYKHAIGRIPPLYYHEEIKKWTTIPHDNEAQQCLLIRCSMHLHESLAVPYRKLYQQAILTILFSSPLPALPAFV